MKNNLKQVLKDCNKTQKELAIATGITECAISRYVKGERTPVYPNMLTIAKFLNVNVKDIWEE